MKLIAPLRLLFRAGQRFAEDQALALSAAVSFYTLLSFAPLMVLSVWIGSSVGSDVQQHMIEQIGLLAGDEAAKAAQAVIENARERPSIGSFAGISGIVVSIVAATTVFAQLQMALNRIWGIAAQPRNAVLGWLRRRLLSLGLIAAIGFVLIASLTVSAVIGMFLSRTGALWELINVVVTALIFTVLFALVFRYLPDARLPGKFAWRGGLLTAVLFMIGKAAIGYYLASGNVGNAYGAAAFVVVLLVWVYYASAIFFFGAEFVQAFVEAGGERIPAAKHAEVIEGDKETCRKNGR